MYYVYIVECSDHTLYTGITTNLARRIDEHNVSKKGASYTKSRRPVTLKYSKRCRTRSSALKKEWTIKQMAKDEKLQVISGLRTIR